MILCSNPLAQYKSHQDEIDSAINRVLHKGWYIHGEEVKAFESEFAAYTGVSYGIGVGNGTEAIHLALAACGIGAGDEVITTSHTAVATIAAIEMAGATPVLVDINPADYTIEPALIGRVITKRTKAIMPVHIYGHPANLEAILSISKKHNLLLVEDCAQAHGASYLGRRVGSWGDIACFSFYPTKNLGALGDGGMIVTNNASFAEKARLLRQYGWKSHYISEIPGINSRLDEIQAAVLRIKLAYLDEDNEKRRRIAQVYHQAFQDYELILPTAHPGSNHVYHLFVIRTPQRDALRSYLKEHNIQSLVHYPVPVHLQSAYADRLVGSESLPQTEQVAQEVLSLPIYPELPEEDLTQVIQAVQNFMEQSR